MQMRGLYHTIIALCCTASKQLEKLKLEFSWKDVKTGCCRFVSHNWCRMLPNPLSAATLATWSITINQYEPRIILNSHWLRGGQIISSETSLCVTLCSSICSFSAEVLVIFHPQMQMSEVAYPYLCVLIVYRLVGDASGLHLQIAAFARSLRHRRSEFKYNGH